MLPREISNCRKNLPSGTGGIKGGRITHSSRALSREAAAPSVGATTTAMVRKPGARAVLRLQLQEPGSPTSPWVLPLTVSCHHLSLPAAATWTRQLIS